MHAGGVKLCGLRAAARTYLEQLHTNTTITHYEPSKKKKLKTRKAVNKRMFRKWCSVVDSWLERIGWPAGRSLTSRFVSHAAGFLPSKAAFNILPEQLLVPCCGRVYVYGLYSAASVFCH